MAERTYVGVDLGWSADPAPESTGLCTIEAGRVADRRMAGPDEEIVSYVLDRDADYVGIDAPLIVKNETGRRPVEAELQDLGFPAFPAQRSFFERAYGGVRGERLVDAFEAHGYRLAAETGEPGSVIEVYPNPTIQAVIGEVPPYKRGTKGTRLRGLRTIWWQTDRAVESIEVGDYTGMLPEDAAATSGPELDRLADLIDAFYSAYVLVLDARGDAAVRTVGELDEGAILAAFPPGMPASEPP